MSIKIGIDAQFNDADVKREIDAINAQLQKLGETVAKSSGMSFNPITLQDKDDLKYFLQMSEKLMKVQGGMRSQMQKSGQGNKNPLFANWGHMYLNEQTRMKRMQEMLVFFGGEFNRPAPPAPAPKPGTPPANPPGNNGPHLPDNPWFRQGMRVLGTGAQSFGPLGGVVSGAVHDGAAGGFGAGMAGLLGGVAALGVSKLISSVMEKVGDAQTEAILNDQLMRRLGGTTSFDALRSGVRVTANDLGMSFNETQALTSQYASSANSADGEALPQEVMTAGRFGRGFGLDPTVSANFFGSMRNLRVTNNDQGARKLGVLIGETIARSGAFAKSDEVMQAIASFVDTQTRLSLAPANVIGYTGAFSALAGSGIPGLDPSGAANLLGRVNSALMVGGAKGEASQFFTSMVAERMGLDPLQMAVLKEGGAFATTRQMFGKDSAAGRYGMRGPQGDQSFLSATLDTLRSKYRDPGLLAMATSNHLGIGMNQAMALLDINPNQMGAIQENLSRLNVDMGTLDAGGIRDISGIAGATDTGLQDIANKMLSRTGKGALSKDENALLTDAMKTAAQSGDTTQLRDLLTVLAAQKGQMETDGSKTRDSIAQVGNVMQEYAAKSLPLMNDARAALLFLAGKQGAGGPRALREWALNSEHEENMKAIEAKYPKAAEAWRKMMEHPTSGPLSASMIGGTDKEAVDLQAQWAKEAKPLIEEQEKERARYKQAKKDLDTATAEDYNAQQAAQQNAAAGTSSPVTAPDYVPPVSADNSNTTKPPVDMGRPPIKRQAGEPDAGKVEQIESGGRMFDKHGGYLKSNKGALGSMQVMPGTLTDPGFGVIPARDNSAKELKRVGVDYLQAMFRRYGDTDQALAAYNWGPGNLDLAIARYGQRWKEYLPQETGDYLRKYHALPVDKSDRESAATATAYNVNVSGEGTMGLDLTDEAKRLLRPTALPSVRFSAASPSGS